MTSIIPLTPTFVPALTSLPWLQMVADQLGDPAPQPQTLVGVDIGHVDGSGHTASEACAGFVMRGEEIQATVAMFTDREFAAFTRIQKTVGTSFVPSRMTHWALTTKAPQINTLVFRTFTLVYECLQLPAAARPSSFQPRLVLHDAAVTLPHDVLSRTMQFCLDSFTSAHEDFHAVRLRAPDAIELAQVMETRAA